MVKGERIINATDVFERTNGGYDIFRWELGDFPLSKNICHPLRGDRHPSAAIICRDGMWFLKDYTNRLPVLNAIQFVRQKYHLSYPETLKKLSSEYIPDENSKRIVNVTWKAPEQKDLAHISFSTCKMDKAHAAYWEAYHLSESYLKSKDVYRVKSLAINRKIVKLNPEELTYAYYARDIDKCKILRIGVKKEEKWRNNAPHNYLWYINSLSKCDKLVISKSVKDCLVLSLFDVCSIATQSEDFSCVEANKEQIDSISNNVYINFGSDSQGKDQSLKITREFGYKHYNTPDDYLQYGVNDVAELAKYDIKALEAHLKLKNIIT